MSAKLHGRLHNHLGMIHTTVEGAFLTAGMVLTTVVTLLIVFVAISFLAR
jgi:hypothetical protein